MVSEVAQLLSGARNAARNAARDARSRVGVGVITAVDPPSQTTSVRPVGGSQPIPNAIPFGVETPIKVNDLVRMFRQGGQVFVSPIETDLESRLAKDSRVAFATGRKRTVIYNGVAHDTVGYHTGRDVRPVRDAAGVLHVTTRAVYLSQSEARAAATDALALRDGRPLAINRNLGTLVETPSTLFRAANVFGSGRAAYDVAGSGAMLPGYAYDDGPDGSPLIDTLLGLRGGDVLPTQEEMWLIDLPPSYRMALVVSDDQIAGGLAFRDANNRRGVRVSLASGRPTGASLVVTWNPNTPQARVDGSSADGDYLNATADITANAARLQLTYRVSADRTLTLNVAYVIASVDIASTTQGRSYDVILAPSTQRALSPYSFVQDVVAAWRAWRELS